MHSDRESRIVEELEEVIRDDDVAHLGAIESRECLHNPSVGRSFDGVSLKLYGDWVPIRPIIKYAAARDSIAIATMDYIHEGDPHLSVFIAYLPRQEHPAFV